jgi:hypothetical protein
MTLCERRSHAHFTGAEDVLLVALRRTCIGRYEAQAVLLSGDNVRAGAID